MAIGDVSMVSSLATLASNMKTDNVATQIGVAVMKQVMDQQEQQAQAIIQMMQQTPRPQSGGSLGSAIDFYA